MSFCIRKTGLALLLVCLPAAAETLCNIHPTGGFAGLSNDAFQIIGELLQNSNLQIADLSLVPTQDLRLRRLGGAAAQTCEGRPKIFYNPGLFTDIHAIGGSDWAKYFVLAHELGHHVLQHLTSDELDLKREAAADSWAASQLGERGASLQEILKQFDAMAKVIGLQEGRCFRRVQVVNGYTAQAAKFNARVGRKQVPEFGTCECSPVASTVAGLYVAEAVVGPGTLLTSQNVHACGTVSSSLDRPLSLQNDLAGMCVVSPRVAEGSLLTWRNVGVCALVQR